jgi:hypothetical protein
MSLTSLTIGGLEYVSYATVAEADGRLAVDPLRSPTWAPKTTDEKSVLLVASTNRLDLLNWAGEKAGGASQKNAWPRTGVTYPDGTPVPSDAVPYEVETACSLLAGSIAMDAKKSGAGSSGGSNVKAVGAGSARVEFFMPAQGVALQDETAFALVKAFLSSALSDSVGFGMASGTGAKGLGPCYGDLDKGYA